MEEDDTMNFSPESRRNILDEYFALYGKILQSSYAPSASRSTTHADELDVCQRRLSKLWKTYEAGLPNVTLSRCPFSGVSLTVPFDALGLDGLWWRYEGPIRGYPKPPPTFMALTGAVQLKRPVENAPFLIVPGPGVPFVYPRLLNLETMKSVVYEVAIGQHKAFVVAYFAQSRPQGVAMPNLWASNNYEFTRPNGSTGTYETFDTAADWDFQLRPWIASGKLLWIAPGDPDMALQSGLENCPYLNLTGEHREQRIYLGDVEVGRPGDVETDPSADEMTKLVQQFDRQIIGRADALKAQGVAANIAQDLQDDMALLRKVQTDAWSSAQVSAALASRGKNLAQVASQVTATLNAIKQLKPQ
jgi:hypothetical protein